IGTNASGTAPLGNAGDGVNVTGGKAALGPDPAKPDGPGGNVISANGGHGVYALGANVGLRGNFIGTDASGNVALGNGGNGVFFDRSTGGIGGATDERTWGPTLGNIISGNRGNGVVVLGP